MSLQLTHNQQLVFDVLEKSGKPISAYDILDALRPAGLKAPLQVYRALEKLVTMELVHKLESLNAFVSCRHSHHHGGGVTAFAICNGCGTVDELHATTSDALVREVDNHGFKVEQTAIEIKGLCRRCGQACSGV
jgi:Fur family zinc uptake transcriptional regulator